MSSSDSMGNFEKIRRPPSAPMLFQGTQRTTDLQGRTKASKAACGKVAVSVSLTVLNIRLWDWQKSWQWQSGHLPKTHPSRQLFIVSAFQHCTEKRRGTEKDVARTMSMVSAPHCTGNRCQICSTVDQVNAKWPHRLPATFTCHLFSNKNRGTVHDDILWYIYTQSIPILHLDSR